jgi:hypothetical protein
VRLSVHRFSEARCRRNYKNHPLSLLNRKPAVSDDLRVVNFCLNPTVKMLETVSYIKLKPSPVKRNFFLLTAPAGMLKELGFRCFSRRMRV